MGMIEVMLLVLVVVLIAATSIVPNRSQLHPYELERRAADKDREVVLDAQRATTEPDVLTVQRVLVAWLLVVIVILLAYQYGWLLGSLLALVVALGYPLLAKLPFLRQQAQRLYDTYEAQLLAVIQRNNRFVRPFRGVVVPPEEFRVQSREEYEHLTAEATAILSKHELRMIQGALTFEEKIIKDHMTPRSVMEVIGAHELLGPLVLDSLHKTGHSHFPVMDGDIDHIVGILHIHSLFNLANKKSLEVRDVMEPNVLYIREDQTLAEALATCIKTRRHLLVVINEFRETVGVVTIEDAIEQLIGQKIVDQFDRHDDLRAVATRNPRANNQPAKAVDM